VEWIHLAQDSYKLRGFVKIVMKLRVSIHAVNFFAGREAIRFVSILFCVVSWLIGLKYV
jgi:hypothetical protein